MIFENKSDGTNLDLENGFTLEHCLQLTAGFTSDLPKPKLKIVDGFWIVDEGAHEFGGAKTRFAEFFISTLPEDVTELVYCQPAVGLAGPSLSYLAAKYNKSLTLFMPARQKATRHQLYCIERGANAIWKRIAAMPNLQRMAADYAANKPGALYIPFGLKHPMVAAGGVRAVYDMFKGSTEPPKEMWTVISTGVLTRVLQIALPDTEFHAVAVARNIKNGELGRAKFWSYHKAFTEKADYIPATFQTVETYDAKGFEYMRKFAKPGAWFYNVAKEVYPQELTADQVDSARGWGE